MTGVELELSRINSALSLKIFWCSLAMAEPYVDCALLFIYEHKLLKSFNEVLNCNARTWKYRFDNEFVIFIFSVLTENEFFNIKNTSKYKKAIKRYALPIIWIEILLVLKDCINYTKEKIVSIVKFEKFYSKNMNGNKINNCKHLIVVL